MKIPYFWEPETLGVTVGGWKQGDVAAKKGVMDIPLPKFAQVGEQEFFVGQGIGDGQFVIESAELLKDGKVVSTNKHSYESSMLRHTWHVYILKNPNTAGNYSVRFHVRQLFGDCSAVVQLNAAMAPDQYSKQCAPGGGANGGTFKDHVDERNAVAGAGIGADRSGRGAPPDDLLAVRLLDADGQHPETVAVFIDADFVFVLDRDQHVRVLGGFLEPFCLERLVGYKVPR